MMSTSYRADRALELLRLGTRNADAVFRDSQEEAIRHIVEGRGRLLVVQKTGWGKSSVYFIAAKLLREQGAGPAILISPLLSLMRDQIRAARRMGVRAVTINSENRVNWESVMDSLRRGEVDVLLISPERLANEDFRTNVLVPVSGRISLLVVDEAHCISDWGHDFRPHYRMIDRLLKQMPRNLRVLATTATANDRVLRDLELILGPGLKVLRGELGRPSLLLQTIYMPSQTERMAWLASHLPAILGSGIIYTLTVRDAVQVAGWLQSRGIDAHPYSGATDASQRLKLEQALLKNEVKALVATCALGMGFDKPDLKFVIHYQSPGSVVAYYQQVGRAGRALNAAHGVLLGGTEDDEINGFFIESAFPARHEMDEVLDVLENAPGGLTLNDLMSLLNLGRGRIEKALLLLSLENPAPVVKQGSLWMRTTTPFSESFWSRADRLSALRRNEWAQMQDYMKLSHGHMEFLVGALDGDSASHPAPAVDPLPSKVDGGIVREAAEFLRRTNLDLEPRKQWPHGGLPRMGVRGTIPEEYRARDGKILCVWGDAGWGDLVRRGKADGRFADQLVEACAAMVRAWAPLPVPVWVTCLPSLRHPGLVPDFASRLAASLGLNFLPLLHKTDDRLAQKQMENGIHQARNVDGGFAIRGAVPSGPVLLVDDMVDSRWTLTVAAYLLTANGSGPVYPLALASTANSNA
jgi:ATP-dependent DNA helicase RecQ